jgi:RNA polymerase sigma-70 factor (ECF subfamily)
MLDAGSETALRRIIRRPARPRGEQDTEVPCFSALYERYFTFVWATAKTFGVDDVEMDDVVQDVFVTVSEQIGSLRQPNALRSWIYTITKRIACAYNRNRPALVVSSGTGRLDPDMEQVEWATPLYEAERLEQRELLCRLLEGLDASRREAIILAELEEMTIPEIARVTGVPINTLYSRLRTARLELEDALRRHIARTRTSLL